MHIDNPGVFRDLVEQTDRLQHRFQQLHEQFGRIYADHCQSLGEIAALFGEFQQIAASLSDAEAWRDSWGASGQPRQRPDPDAPRG